MTLRNLLTDLERLGKEDGALDREIDFPGILDYLSIAGLPGASAAYINSVADATSND